MRREPKERSCRTAPVPGLLWSQLHRPIGSVPDPSLLRRRAGARARRFCLTLALACSLVGTLPIQANADSPESRSPIYTANPALTAGLRGNQLFGGACNVPTDGARSPLFGADSFSQQLLRFEELGSKPLAQPTDEDPLAGSCCPSRSSVHGESNAEPCAACPLKLPSPHDAADNDCGYCTVNSMELDALLRQRIHPYPTRESTSEGPSQTRTNDWEECIENTHTGPLSPMEPGGISSYGDGRPEGPQYGHQRWDEFFPPSYVETVVAGARTNTGLRDSAQRHDYQRGEFAPGGLYHNTTGKPGSEATTKGIEIRFHPMMPVQDHQTLWTFDGTLPPKLLLARYGEGVLFRNHNALPIKFEANRGFGNHFISTHEHNGHNPAESDGYTQAYFLPGQHYDYHWPMLLAGHDPLDGDHINNADARDARAGTPCEDDESLIVSYPSPMLDGSGKTCERYQKLSENPTRNPGESNYADPSACGWRRVLETCDAGRINIPGDWRETMSTHWFHDHMLDYTAQNVYKGNAAMFNMYSSIDRGNECVSDGVNLGFASGCALGPDSWGNRDYDVNLLVSSKAWGQDPMRYEGTAVDDTRGQLWYATFNTDGFLGDRMTVNWLYDPYFDVRARRYRFRILNGDVARFMRIALVVKRNDGSGEFPGSSTRFSYDRVPFHLIANDGNILEHAVPFDGSMDLDRDGATQDHNGILPTLSVAERYDIIVDLSEKNSANIKPGDRLYLVNLLEHHNGKRPHQMIPLSEVLSGEYERDGNCDPTVGRFLELRVHEYAGTDLSMDPADYIPGKKQMIPLPELTSKQLEAAHHRTFRFGNNAVSDKQPVTITNASFTDAQGSAVPNQTDTRGFSRGGPSVNDDELDQLIEKAEDVWGIRTDNGSGGMLTADPHRVSAAPKLGDLEVWHLEGNGGWSHNIHIHFEEGRILTRDGKVPPEWEKWARKDIYRVGRMDDSGSEVTVAIRFREFAGSYMEHCHNTTHEDHSMLMRWDLENPGQLKPFLTPEPQWNGCSYTESYELPTASANRSRVVGDPKAKEEFYQRYSVPELLGLADAPNADASSEAPNLSTPSGASANTPQNHAPEGQEPASEAVAASDPSAPAGSDPGGTPEAEHNAIAQPVSSGTPTEAAAQAPSPSATVTAAVHAPTISHASRLKQRAERNAARKALREARRASRAQVLHTRSAATNSRRAAQLERSAAQASKRAARAAQREERRRQRSSRRR